jgi:hypothetical protein
MCELVLAEPWPWCVGHCVPCRHQPPVDDSIKAQALAWGEIQSPLLYTTAPGLSQMAAQPRCGCRMTPGL